MSYSYSPIRTIQYRGFVIEKVVEGFAYASNGNAHNPTPRYRWDVRTQGGRILSWKGLLREAKGFVDFYIEDTADEQPSMEWLMMTAEDRAAAQAGADRRARYEDA